MKPVLMWGGFIDDELHVMTVDAGYGGYGTGDMVDVPAIFTTRAEARKKYKDVRRVQVGEK